MKKLAIIGRPNVGKSALFNRLCKKRISIVDEAEGITRDRLYAKADFFGRPFEVIDTGGIDPNSHLDYSEAIRRQAEIAMEEADVFVLVVDGKVGLTRLDEEVAHIAHQKNKPVTLAINKVDHMSQMDRVHDFHSLGITQIVGVSAVHGIHIAELLETVFQDMIWEDEEKEQDNTIKVAVVGRANVGKSTLVNQLLNEERCLVGPIAGTTRDSVDSDIEVENVMYRLIDTAGIRRKKSEKEALEKFAAIRTERAIERSDVCLLMLDAKEGLTSQEKRIAKEIEEQGKGCILLFNKWDLIKGIRMEACLSTIRREVPFLAHCPTLFISAKTKRNLDKIYEQVQTVHQNRCHRVSTGELNRFLENAMQKYHPPMLKGKRLRIYYIAQVRIQPPHFVLFVNHPRLMVDTYQKYLINVFRKTFPFMGSPLRFSLKGKIDRTKKQK